METAYSSGRSVINDAFFTWSRNQNRYLHTKSIISTTDIKYMHLLTVYG